MAYRPQGQNLPPIRTPSGYDAVQLPPPSPRLDSAFSDNRDIQDDPYLQNPNLPPQQNRFYGAAMHNDYQRQSLAGSEVSLHHPQGASIDSPYTPYESTPAFRSPVGGPQSASNQHFDPYRDEPDSHQMAYLGGSRPYEPPAPEKLRQPAYPPPRSSGKKKRIIIIAIVALVILAAAAVCVYIFIIKPKSADDDSSKPAGSKDSTAPKNLITTGGDGSTVTMDDGSAFTYKNSFGGFWVYDPNAPFNDTAQAQSYVPPLNQPWKFGTDRIRG